MIDFTVTEETVSKLYVEINESKVPLGLTIDFLTLLQAKSPSSKSERSEKVGRGYSHPTS
jgi:hypothetical protein